MSYNRQGQVPEDCRSKRQQILNAAFEVFSRKGYHQATVDEIIALADTGKGTVYNYFVNKEQLFYTLIQERIQPFETGLERVATSGQPALAIIESMVLLFLQFYIENAGLWRIMIHEMRGFDLKPEIRDRHQDIYRRTTGWLEKVIAEGVSQGILRESNVAKASSSLFAVILTMVFQDTIGDDVEAAAHNITDIFLYGMARR